MLAAKLYCEDRSERLAVELSGTLRDDDWRPVDITVDEVSTTGARVRTQIPLRVGEVVTIGIEGLGLCPARVMRAAGPELFGLAFVKPFTQYELEASIQRENVATFVPPVRFETPTAAEPDAPVTDERYPIGIRALIILGTSVATWAAIGGAVLTLAN